MVCFIRSLNFVQMFILKYFSSHTIFLNVNFRPIPNYLFHYHLPSDCHSANHFTLLYYSAFSSWSTQIIFPQLHSSSCTYSEVTMQNLGYIRIFFLSLLAILLTACYKFWVDYQSMQVLLM